MLDRQMIDGLFPADLPEPQVWQEYYPERGLPPGALVTRFSPSPTGHLHIGGVYAATGSTDETDLTLYADPNPLERGRFYSLKIVANFQNDETGFAQVWRDGIQIVDYSGPLGYGQAVYWKEGIYRYPTNQTIAARYQNTILTSDLCFAEGMPVLRLDDYGNPVFLLVPCNDGAATVVAPERPDTVRVLRELR